MSNFIIKNKNISDFKLLNSIRDEQFDISYMLNATAKHNAIDSMKYLEKKLLVSKDNKMLEQALVYAIKSQSIDTTIYLMNQKIDLDSEIQKFLLLTLQ